jgi:hypothetical protein
MAAQEFLTDEDGIGMLVTCALDLLAQTEAQHRAIVAAQSDLDGCVAEWKVTTPTAFTRKKRLAAIAEGIAALLTAIRTQRLLAVEMQQVVSSLQRKS